jgi:PAS domain S-box-containing protein
MSESWRSNTHLSRLAWLVAASVFIVALLAPPQIELTFLFLGVVFLAIFFKEKSDALLMAVVVTTMIVLACAFNPGDKTFPEKLMDRLPEIFACWAATYFVIRFMLLREAESAQEGKFSALFQYASSGIFLTDDKGQIVLANPAVETLFGYQSGEMTGKHVEDLIPARYKQTHIKHRDNYNANPHARTMGTGLDLLGLKADGTEFPVEVSLSPFKKGKDKFVVAFVIDNTYRKQYERSILEQKEVLAALSHELQDLNEQLEHKVIQRTLELEAAKNELAQLLSKERELGELKTRFVSMASHEFRTPLSTVLSSASLIATYADKSDFPNIKKHTERIKNAVNGLNTILTEFLSLGRLEEGRIQPNIAKLNLPECINEVTSELRILFRSGQTLDYQHTGPDETDLDAGLLRNILINLISNAIKYSSENTEIKLRSEITPEYIRISVRDKGIGIPLDEQKHLFTRFFRATNATNITGTGLGMYIVKRYVDMLNGEISFSSAPEEGTEFVVQFPPQMPQSESNYHGLNN